MEGAPRAVTWTAPEHHHVEKTGEWFIIMSIVTATVTVVSLLFGNVLFALLTVIAGVAIAVAASKKPRDIQYAVTVRGIRVGEELFPYPTLDTYYIDEDDPKGPQLLVKSKRHFMPLVVLPLPEMYIDDVEDILSGRLEEEHLEEPFLMVVLEALGF